MRILFVTHNLDYEGATLFLLSVAKGLKARGYHAVIYSTEDGPLRDVFQAEGMHVIIHQLNHRNIGLNDFVKEVRRVICVLDSLTIDLVFCNTLNTYYGLHLAMLMNRPALWCIHESTYFYDHLRIYCGNRALTKVAIECFRIPAQIIFDSKATAAMYGEAERNPVLRIIHNGIDIGGIEKFKREHSKTSLRQRQGIPLDRQLVTLIGTTCDRKGQLVFIRAAASLLEKNRNLLFYIVGGREGDYLDRMRALIFKSGIAEYVKIIPETREIYPYYRMSDIFVSASFEEAFPLVILEAMAFRLPIVTTNVFGVAEQVRPLKEALLVPPGNHGMLSNRISELLLDKQYAAEMAENAYRRVVNEFTSDAMVQSYDRCIQQCVGVGPGGYAIDQWRGQCAMLSDQALCYFRAYMTYSRRNGIGAANQRVSKMVYEKITSVWCGLHHSS